MSRVATGLIATMLLSLLVGCGGSSADLPEDVLTQDAYALVWTDIKSIKPADGEQLLADLADDMPDEQPRARLWLSAEADDIASSYDKKWNAFTEASCEGILTVYYRIEKSEGDGPFSTVNYRRHTFIKAGKSAKADDLEKSLKAFAEKDGNDKLKFVAVGEKTGWFWLTREGADDSLPKMPSKGDEETAKAFKKLLDQGKGAAVIAAWRFIKPMSDEIDKQLKDDTLSEDRKEDLERAGATQSVVMSCAPGKSPKVSVVITFDDSEQAKAYAKEENDKMLESRGDMKRELMSAENPPHPSVIDRLSENMQIKTSGKTATLTMDKSMVKDTLNLIASSPARSVKGSADLTSPASLLPFDAMLRVPGADQVPGVRSCYEQLNFGWNRLPQ